jgi:type II secretory pathway pseudopilin PulG
MQQTDSIQPVETAEAAESAHSSARTATKLRRRRRDGGAMLLAVLFMMAMMVIVAMAMAPSFVQQMKRDREEEMIHRGTEYARAIKKYYKKFGRYPANLEQLENTNQVRFLRKRYKDPLTKDGQWKLLHAGDIQAIAGMSAMGMPAGQMPGQVGAPGVQLGPQSGLQGQGSLSGAIGGDQSANGGLSGAQSLPQQINLPPSDHTPSDVQTSGVASPFITQSSDQTAQPGAGFAPGAGQSNSLAAGQTAGSRGQAASNNSIFGNTGVGGQTFGGGAIVGVASKDKDPTIRIFNKKKTYDEWQFIYSPIMDRVNVLLRGPYNGQSYGGAQTPIGTPAGQLNQSNQGTPGASGMQPGGFGQQNPTQNQQITPGGQFPPDQNQPQ